MTESSDAELAPTAFERHQWGRRDALIYQLRLSALYHQKRARYFELSAKLMQAIAVLASTTAVVQVLESNRPAQIFASIIVAVVSTLLLVYAPNTKANLHANMVRDYRRLLSLIHAAGEHPESEQIDRWNSECVGLEAQEPSTLSALVAECQYQLGLGTSGGSSSVVRPSWWKRGLMHLIDFAPEPPTTKRTG